jgi:hypothetical protein
LVKNDIHLFGRDTRANRWSVSGRRATTDTRQHSNLSFLGDKSNSIIPRAS